MQDAALQTIVALEQRLNRLSFLLHGHGLDGGDVVTDTDKDKQSAPNGSASIASRLQSLGKSLQAIAVQSTSAAELLRLQKQNPMLFDEPSMTDPSHGVADAALAHIVLAHTPAYHTTAAQLTSLNDLPVPQSSSSAALLAQVPRIQRAQERQEEQARVIAQLRQQSVALVGRWYESGIVAMNDCWTEGEARLMVAERTVRRAEAAKRRAEESI